MLGGQVYRDAKGKSVRLAYSARQAKLFAVDLATAASLAGNRLDGLGAEQIESLKGIDALVDDTQDELGAVLAKYRTGSADPGVRGFTIMPTSYCNMACDYCGQEHYKAAVNQAKVDRLAARVEATIADPATTHVSVTWFGGEPLLALRVIRELSARFIAAADSADKGYSARMATNGSLLTGPTLRMLHHECRLDSMEVTIDGPEALHDQRRIKRNGIGSFHKTIAALAAAVREQAVPKLRIGIRINVDADNEEHVADLINDLACFGLNHPQVELHMFPVHSWGNDVSTVELEARRYAAKEAGWLRQARSLGIGFQSVPDATKRTTCRATSVYGEIVESAEKVYSCSEHPLVPVVRDTGVVATVSQLQGSAPRPLGMFDDWFDQVGDGEQQCGRCPLLPVCGGSCPKLWREGHMPCPSMKFNWDARVDIAARRLGYEPVE